MSTNVINSTEFAKDIEGLHEGIFDKIFRHDFMDMEQTVYTLFREYLCSKEFAEADNKTKKILLYDYQVIIDFFKKLSTLQDKYEDIEAKDIQCNRITNQSHLATISHHL